MILILGVVGWMIFGKEGLIIVALFGVILVTFSTQISPRLVLKMYSARLLQPQEARELYDMISILSKRADLPSIPKLFYIPSKIMTAFAIGRRSDSAIAITDGLFRNLRMQEIIGVLAHELCHIQNNDLFIHSLADLLSRITSFFAIVGQLLILIYLSLYLFVDINIPWALIVWLIIAPTLSVLLQLALSRTREFDADLGAVKLTGDPVGLASALRKLEIYRRSIWDIFLMPGRKVPVPSFLRTHPDTDKRIEKLLSLATDKELSSFAFNYQGDALSKDIFEVIAKPRRRRTGIWY